MEVQLRSRFRSGRSALEELRSSVGGTENDEEEAAGLRQNPETQQRRGTLKRSTMRRSALVWAAETHLSCRAEPNRNLRLQAHT